MKIVFCASEVFPFAKTGGLADVMGALPLALENFGQEIIIIMPAYKTINNSNLKIEKSGRGIPFSKIGKNLKVYFIENKTFFNRPGLYGTNDGDFPDNLERFVFFDRMALKLLKKIDFKPDIIHCNDWQTSLIPVYLKTIFRGDLFFKNTKTILTIHNLGYQGLFPKEEFSKLGLQELLFNIEGLEFYDKINLLKGGIIFSDAITTVSPTYSKEIQGKVLGFGLEGVLKKRSDSLYGIINGLDYSTWDPAHDEFIEKKYSALDLKDKIINKQALQKICGFPQEDVALFGIVSRLAEQKGLEIILKAMDEICSLNLQLVVLGMGDQRYHLRLEKIAKKYTNNFSLFLKFDESLAHKIYAGSDLFLMPSQYEPCGLGQMISLKYATLPLVFKTGGLADTVSPDNGFVFNAYTKGALVDSIKTASLAFKDRSRWSGLMRKAVSYNFSWEESAKKYLDLYKKIVIK